MTMPPAIARNETPLSAVILRITRLLMNSHFLGWADQAVVSATSLLVLVMIGRWTDPHQLGIYAIGISILALLIATQESLITRPYSIQLHEPSGAIAEYAFSAFSLSVMLSVAAALVIGTVALLLSAFDASPGLVEIGWVLAGSIPFILMREFARRFAFAHLTLARALILDLGVAVSMLFILAVFGWLGRLSASSAFAVMGIACGLASVGWFYLTRDDYAWSLSQFKATLRRSWQMGKWFLSSQLAIQAQGYVTPWLTLTIAGTAATGIFTACATTVAFANPLLYGYFNVLLPRFVLTLKKQGAGALKRQAYLAALLLAGIMGAFSFAVFAGGDAVMRLLFPGESYSGYGEVLTVLALASLAASVGAPASIALAAAGLARRVAGITALTAILYLALIATLLPGWGLLGAAYGMLAAEAIGSAGRWLAFLLAGSANAPAGQEPRPAQSQTLQELPRC